MSRYGLINGRIHAYLTLDSSSWGRRWGRSTWNFLTVRIRVCKVVSVHAINAVGLWLPPFLIAVLYIGCQFYVLLEVSPPWRRHFCRVRRLAWCNDPESYAGGSVATGRVTLAGQIKGEHPDKERYTGPPGWGLGRWASTSSPDKKKTRMLKNLDRGLEKRTVYQINDMKLEKG